MADHTGRADVSPPSGDPTGWDVEQEWEHATLRRAVVYGVRLFNDGAFHDAYDCFKNVWPGVNKLSPQETGFERAAASL